MRRTLLTLSTLGLLAGTASADLLEEVRFGVLQHNICVQDCNNADKEDGPNINGELVFKSPNFLSIIWSPRPYVMGSANTAGNTSFGAVGLTWDWEFADGWSLELGEGYAIHSGELESPFPQGDPRGDAFTEKHVLLGSRDLFRTSFGLNYEFSDSWGGQILYEHLSHGQIIGSGRNQGLDNLGVRVIYKFGG
ncbi:acyloxyacyl hydrolase [Hyphomonas johnsonii]|uniref:Lipid A 3-O-deacylase-like protein n=1 Tax=Hyphomonas johnsonii MHS-2 TaxID=1280950 RepID=A0A059FQ55_9PROT|nr:acyloxyacyl hydrolase [Hyphomonas johnsonii]KCZ92646.1 hypothetical protein HJO_06822 [Hyphomonas johnsonii MHS-2]